jgi:hypothetical protein
LTDYYWVVDEVNGATTWSGQVWSFQTENAITDPNLLLWYRLDEAEEEYDSQGYEASDSSDYLRHAYLRIRNFLLDYTSPPWAPDGGRWGGALEFSDDTAIWVPHGTLNTLSDAVSIVVWIQDGTGWVLQANGGDSQLTVQILNDVTWRAGNDTDDVLTMAGKPSGWNHYAFIKDETKGKIQIYFNGELAESDDVVDNTLIGVRSKPFKIGGRTGGPMDFLSAWMDDFMVYNRALTPAEVVRQYYSGGRVGELGEAWRPYPADGATEVVRDVVLTWKPGDYAASHDVYFGTDWDDVNDADTSSGQFQENRGPNEWDPPGNLVLDTAYYWRIDEVNDPCVWKGHVWSFTTATFLVIDDFESYDDTNRIYHTWEDQGVNWTGSQLDLGRTPFAPVHAGNKSMLYLYDNTQKWDFFSYWSLAELPFAGPQDWTEVERKTLTLYLHGLPDNDINDTEQLYVAVDDDLGGHAEIPYPDMNDLQLEEWTEWNIPISDFTSPDDVDETQITRLGLVFGSSSNTTIQGGLGIVYFDDIRLYASRCVPEIIQPQGDLSDDCAVTWLDVEIMAEEWLESDVDVSPVQNPGSTNLVGHWELEGDANDSSGNNYHGSAEGNHNWIDGKIGSGAIELTGGWVVVEDAGSTPKLRPANQVSIAAWINLASSPPGGTRLVIKGRDDYESYATETDGDGFKFFIRDPIGSDSSVSSEAELPLDEWVHIAGTYDNNDLTVYQNGQADASITVGAKELLADANDGLGIGGRYGDSSNRFEGAFDDVRIYDRGLTRAEVAYLASQGTGTILLDSEANLYSGELVEVINIRDLAVMLDHWLEVELWP